MANLAIKGHVTRGKEVIEILEMLGGKNYFYYDGTDKDLIYTIGSELELDVLNINSSNVKNGYIVFTLEEFLEKYPYKVGDKVDYIKYDDEFSVYEIIGMVWTGTTIEYTLDSFGFTCLTKDIRLHKENNMNKFKSLNVETYLKVWDETEKGLEVLVNDRFELKEDNGKFYVVKKPPQYPKTYEECCKVLDMLSDWHLTFELNNATSRYLCVKNEFDYICRLEAFRKLLICRNAYWKIAGVWKPDWGKADEKKYCIVNTEGYIAKWVQKTTNKILAFPTAEMRDAFYENFKDLIEGCKELL